jgi:exopolyphosphatase/pppGpp-phosphohydrolase
MKLKSKLFDNFQMGETMIKLTIILRISVILLRGRSSNPIPLPKISFNHDGNGDDQIEIIFEEEWLQQHALTQYDLNAEAAQLKNIGFKLHYSANL